MYGKRIFLAITALALVTMACGINIDLPFTTDIKTGPTVVEEINIPQLDDPGDETELSLSFGAGELYLNPGADDGLVVGTATYNVEDLKPEITTETSQVELSTGDLDIDGIPDFRGKVVNTWDFKLGDTPMDLEIKAGAYVGDFDLGGLMLRGLHISDGAADVDLDFSEPNQVVMKTLRYETGASNISMKNLVNANFQNMILQSGAGNYELDFSGTLVEDATVLVESGLSSVTIIVPEGTQARVSLEGNLTNITTRGVWEQSGNDYFIDGDGPMLDITVELSAGNLILRNP
jgi:hypothetical protein